MTETETRIKAGCPVCNRAQHCDVVGTHHESWHVDHGEGNSAYGTELHRILRCRGCEKIFYWLGTTDSEDRDNDFDTGHMAQRIVTWPRCEKKPRPQWVSTLFLQDIDLFHIMHEVYEAAASESYILAAVGLRTAFDRSAEVLGVLPGATFVAKIDWLREQGFIGDTERDILKTVADAGNAAAHRGWRPNEPEFNLLRNAVEMFIERTIVAGKRALEIKDRIPPRR